MSLVPLIDFGFDQSLDKFFNHALGCTPARLHSNRLDVTEHDDRYTMTVETPGVKKEDLKIHVNEDNRLVITGESKRHVAHEEGQSRVEERSYGSFNRSLQLPRNADGESVKAQYEDGILRIDLPKKVKQKDEQRFIDIA